MEEIAHVLLIPLLAQDPNTRRRIYNELLVLGGYKVGQDGRPIKDSSITNPNRVVGNLIAQRVDDYQSQNQGVFEEEVIIGFLVNYAEAPNNFGKPRDKGFIARIFEAIKNLFRGKIRAGQLPSNVINFNDSLLDMAEKFREASKFGKEMEIEADPLLIKILSRLRLMYLQEELNLKIPGNFCLTGVEKYFYKSSVAHKG